MNKYVVTKNKQTRGISIVPVDTKIFKNLKIDSKSITNQKDKNYLMDPIPTIEKNGVLYLNP